jgi:hypothetical protein
MRSVALLSSVVLATVTPMAGFSQSTDVSSTSQAASVQRITDVLATAKEVGARYSGWKYFRDRKLPLPQDKDEIDAATDKTVNCSTFMVAVFDELLNRVAPDTSAKTRRAISDGVNVVGISGSLDEAITQRQPKTKGVVHALCRRGLAEEVELEDVKRGDFVQYWYLDKGKWAGHTGIVESIVKQESSGRTKIQLYGAHSEANGIATIEVQLWDSGDKLSDKGEKSRRATYVARLKQGDVEEDTSVKPATNPPTSAPANPAKRSK